MYRRLLLKFSGEQLAGQHGFGIDPEVIHYVAKECAKVMETGCQLVIVAGGGNMVRGAQVAGHGIKRVTADQMGMLSGLMNAMGMTDIFESEGLATRCMSNVYAEQLTESYSFRLAEKHLERGRIVVIAGGMARPYFTHDTAAISFALELSCDAALKASKVDGIYDKDPKASHTAVRYERLTFQEAIENSNIMVMDKAALGLAMEQGMPVIVFDAMQPDNLVRLARGEAVGIKIF
jgi:uridylate kinase